LKALHLSLVSQTSDFLQPLAIVPLYFWQSAASVTVV